MEIPAFAFPDRTECQIVDISDKEMKVKFKESPKGKYVSLYIEMFRYYVHGEVMNKFYSSSDNMFIVFLKLDNSEKIFKNEI